MAFQQILRDTVANWENQNTVLALNQVGVESDIRNNIEYGSGLAKLGNGIDGWSALPPWNRPLTSYLATTVTYNDIDVLANTPLSVNVAAGGIYAIELVVHSTVAFSPLNTDFAGTATIAKFIGE